MSRSQEHEVEIRAPAEAVWRAISEGEELRRWYVEDARVEGDDYWVSWGEGMEGTGKVVVRDAPRRLKLEEAPWAGMEPLPEPIWEEYTIESRGGTTVLRFVHGGIPDSPDWDGMYDSTQIGWRLFFATLRHYLERHPGKPRRTASLIHRLEHVEPGGWERLAGGLGLAADRLEGRFPGRVLLLQESSLLSTVDALDDGLLVVSYEPSGEGALLWATLSAYGDAGERLDEVGAGFEEWLAGLVAQPEGSRR
jgi:uncharacterized protein YndB with AHSA1/START domain